MVARTRESLRSRSASFLSVIEWHDVWMSYFNVCKTLLAKVLQIRSRISLMISTWILRFGEMFCVITLSCNCVYYSFKIFPKFWLAKSTRIIHHNQLLMTKFQRILCLTRKWRQKCSLLQVKKTCGEDLGSRLNCFGCEKKIADISLVSRVRTTAGTRRNNN